MKIIDQTVHQFFETPTDFDGCLKLIERAGRCCYGSTDKITEDSARPFVGGLIKRGHLSVLRHSNLVIADIGMDIEPSPYIKKHHRYLMSGNWQAWLESKYPSTELTAENILDWLRKLYSDRGSSAPPELKRYTAHITTSLRNSHQLVRHTTLAVSQKSTRYCDHSDLEVIKPWWDEQTALRQLFRMSMSGAEYDYRLMIDSHGLTKEDAADVLPKATATELWLTGDRNAWLNLKAQRLDNSTGKASRQMQELMKLIPWEVVE